MRTLYIERSVADGRRGDWTEELDLSDVGRIVVGTGPGSFAGVRAAIAFAQGYALGKPSCEVFGLPSPCALAGDGRVAVVGDARRGLFWVALFDGFRQNGDVFLSDAESLPSAVPDGFRVVTTDEARIGESLRGVFGPRYAGGGTPTGEGLRRFAEANPAALVREPLPIYLTPAVRPAAD